MIRDKLTQARDTMATAVHMRDDKAANEKLNARLAALNVAAGKLQSLVDLITAIQESGIVPQVLTTEQVRTLYSSVNDCSQKAAQNGCALTESDVAALHISLESCRSSAAEKWRAGAAVWANDVCNSLTALSHLLPDSNGARDLLKKLESARNELPSSPNAVMDFINHVQKAQKMVDTLRLDAEAEVFITKVRLGKATLADLDDHILQWVQNNHLSDKLKICFS